MTSPCGSCEAPVWWARSYETGAMMPVDDEPDAADGNIAVSRDPFGVLVWRPLGDHGELREGEHRGRPHFATCPNADEHRKPRAILCGRRGELTDRDREAVEQFALFLEEQGPR